MHKIIFLPEGKEIEVDDGVSILEAAQKTGIFINNLCGGNGVCGKCKVQVKNGGIHADRNSMSLLSKEEISQGYVLACQTSIRSDMEIVIPPESSLEGGQILLDEEPLSYSKPEKIMLHRLPSDPAKLFDPLTRSVYLEMEAPTFADNLSDSDRVIRELRKKTGHDSFQCSLGCIQNLATELREGMWKATFTLVRQCNDAWRMLHVKNGDNTDNNFGLAVDIGTTTVVVQLINMKSGNVVGVEGNHNLQSRYGEDVISRMIYACGRQQGLNSLHTAIIKNINDLIRSLCKEKGVNPEDIHAIAAAGNTTMSHLFLNLIPCSIRLEPYIPTASIYPQISAKDIGIDIDPDAVIETVPSISSYVGGDIVAGILACGIADTPEIKVLIDIGTNGEIAVGNNEWLVCCSASAGPAFEGGGIKHGMRATRGAIEKISIEDGHVSYKTIGNAKPRGLCGSGLIDCLYELSRNHLIDGEGALDLSDKNERVIEKDGEAQFILAYSSETENGHELVITQSDINHLIRSKGAIFAAIKSLMDYVGLGFGDIATFYVAGGFGSFLDIKKSIGIGLLPDINPDKIQFVGNSSLMGARIYLLSTHVAERAIQVARMTTNIELSNYQPFMDEYVAAMFLPHTDRRLFPSVDY